MSIGCKPLVEGALKESSGVQTFIVEYPAVYSLVSDPGQPSGLMISEDFGETWNELNLVLEENNVVMHIAIHPNEEGVYAVGTAQEHLFQTVDGGQNWLQLAESGRPVQ